jgi:hypothetical protein
MVEEGGGEWGQEGKCKVRLNNSEKANEKQSLVSETECWVLLLSFLTVGSAGG